MGVFKNQNRSYIDNRAHSATTLNTYGVIRKYMNGAVYVESPANTSESCLLSSKYSLKQIDSEQSLKRVKCSCSHSSNSCSIHKKFERESKRIFSNESTRKKLEALRRDITSIVSSRSENLEDLKLSIESLASNSSETEKQDFDYQNWVVRKNEEKKRILQREVQIKGKQEKIKQLQLNQERDNFTRWLNHKKIEKEKRQMDKEKELAEQKIKVAQKERRLKESKLKFQLWLKEKEEKDLIKKIEKQMKEIQISTFKQQRLEENERAFQLWLRSSKDKPKPLPTGQGLDSLRSAVSVAYINPIPWTANIDQLQKPFSQ